MLENKELLQGFLIMLIGMILTMIVAAIIATSSSMNSNNTLIFILIISGFLSSGFVGGLLAKNYYLKAVRSAIIIEYGSIELLVLLAILLSLTPPAYYTNIIAHINILLLSICVVPAAYLGHSVVSK